MTILRTTTDVKDVYPGTIATVDDFGNSPAIHAWKSLLCTINRSPYLIGCIPGVASPRDCQSFLKRVQSMLSRNTLHSFVLYTDATFIVASFANSKVQFVQGLLFRRSCLFNITLTIRGLGRTGPGPLTVRW